LPKIGSDTENRCKRADSRRRGKCMHPTSRRWRQFQVESVGSFFESLKSKGPERLLEPHLAGSGVLRTRSVQQHGAGFQVYPAPTTPGRGRRDRGNNDTVFPRCCL
jgi:hypothetical protein